MKRIKNKTMEKELKPFEKGDKLPLTDEQKKQLSDIFNKSLAYEETIKQLSESASLLKKDAWGLVAHWFPGSDKLHLNYTRDNEDSSVTVTGFKQPRP